MIHINKFHEPISIGYGTYLRNPDEVNIRLINEREQRLWVKHENKWYRTKLMPSLGEDKPFIETLQKKTYCKEQYLDTILSVI
jgi:hypothetical protein